MSVLASKLFKLETAAGIGLSPQEQLSRLAKSLSSETLLQVLAWVRAKIKGVEPPPVSDDIVSLAHRIMALLEETS